MDLPMLRDTPAFLAALQAASDRLRDVNDRSALRGEEAQTLARDPLVARAHARETASRLRFHAGDIAEILAAAGEIEAAAAATLAREALTKVISATYNAPPEGPEVFVREAS